ncbi:hypothetical protein SRHO_G00247100 [Serrasalmus rhombeus]
MFYLRKGPAEWTKSVAGPRGSCVQESELLLWDSAGLDAVVMVTWLSSLPIMCFLKHIPQCICYSTRHLLDASSLITNVYTTAGTSHHQDGSSPV